jgi:hypothetical protein
MLKKAEGILISIKKNSKNFCHLENIVKILLNEINRNCKNYNTNTYTNNSNKFNKNSNDVNLDLEEFNFLIKSDLIFDFNNASFSALFNSNGNDIELGAGNYIIIVDIFFVNFFIII